MIEETGNVESTDHHEAVIIDVRKISVRRKLCQFCGCLVSDPCETPESEFCERNSSSCLQVKPD